MRTIQAVARYFPESCGGIHIHLSELLPILKTYGVESKVAASQDEAIASHYFHEGTEIFRYPVSRHPKSEPNHGAVPHAGFEVFTNWLREQDAMIYHQHQWTPKCGLPHLQFAKSLGMKTVVSVRLPQPICQRQTLMWNGDTACDGKINVARCSRCCGVAAAFSDRTLESLSRLPVPVGVAAHGVLRRLKNASVSLREPANFLLYALSLPIFIAARKQSLNAMAHYADRIVVMSQWVYDALMINGIPERKLFLLRHGISETFIAKRETSPHTKSGVLRIGFLGRWAYNKGIHVLVEAIQQLPEDCPIELIIHGVPQDEDYQTRILQRIVGDSRIQVKPSLSREELPQALANFDLLAVPSQWLETGPVVVLEAHAQGIPVIGSHLGGIAEKIRHGIDGLLVPAGDASAWATAFAQLVESDHLLTTLRQGILPVRTIADEATESAALYRSLLEEQAQSSLSEQSLDLRAIATS